MKPLGISNLIALPLIMVALFACTIARSEGRCYECYARTLEKAIIDRDVLALKDIVGNPGLLDDENMDLAVGASVSSFRSFLIRSNITIFVESVADKSTDNAIITFVRSSSLTKSGLAGRSEIKSLRIFKDYFSCEITYKGGRLQMVDHFCFAETNIVEEQN